MNEYPQYYVGICEKGPCGIQAPEAHAQIQEAFADTPRTHVDTHLCFGHCHLGKNIEVTEQVTPDQRPRRVAFFDRVGRPRELGGIPTQVVIDEVKNIIQS